MNIIAQCLTGSRLYGLHNSQSDVDFAGIYLPSLEELLLGKAKELIVGGTSDASRKNTAADTDVLTYSLAYFIFLACNGKQQVIDMLHARDSSIIVTSPIWKALQDSRSHFYSKSMSSSLDFINKQIAAYGHRIKADEDLAAVEQCLVSIKERYGNVKIREFANELPVNDYCYFVTSHERVNTVVSWSDYQHSERLVFYRVDGGLMEISLTLNQLSTYLDERIAKRRKYVQRTLKENQGKSILWSEVSHAMRVGYQFRDILTKGDFEYPLVQSDFLKAIKSGALDFRKDIQAEAESLVADIKRLLFTSSLPDTVDTAYWDEWLLHQYRQLYLS